FRLISHDVLPVDLPGKVDGTARYSIDIRLPRMLYGAVLRAPIQGSVPDTIDKAKIRAAADGVEVFRMPWGVGVLAETQWAALKAHAALADNVTWTRTGRAWDFDDCEGLKKFAEDAKDVDNKDKGTLEWLRMGNGLKGLEGVAAMMAAEYRCDYAYHAQMEP